MFKIILILILLLCCAAAYADGGFVPIDHQSANPTSHQSIAPADSTGPLPAREPVAHYPAVHYPVVAPLNIPPMVQTPNIYQIRKPISISPRTQEIRKNNHGTTVYSPEECIGPLIMGECKESILPKGGYHKTCYGQMLNGQCIGPMF